MLSGLKRKAVRNALELKLRRCKGNDLQKFLGDLMAKVHGENFIPAGTDYSRGDLKNDGLLRDPLTLFACYGPVNAGAHTTEASMRTAVAKVGSDFAGALENWSDLKEWVFVTNYLDTPAQITQEVLRLDGATPSCRLRTFGRAQFEKHILDLPEDDIDDLLGNDATEEDFRALQPQEVLAVVAAVMDQGPRRKEDDAEPTVVPADKLEFNKLEDVFQDRLTKGFQNSRNVARLLSNHPDPLLESEFAAVFKAKYQDLDAQGLAPGEVMDELYEFALAGQRPTTYRDIAVWSVLAYLFEKCTIFKDRPVDGAPVEEAA